MNFGVDASTSAVIKRRGGTTRKMYKTISPHYTIHSTYSAEMNLPSCLSVNLRKWFGCDLYRRIDIVRNSGGEGLNMSQLVTQNVADDDESEGRDNDEDEEFESKDDASDRNDDDSDNFSRLL